MSAALNRSVEKVVLAILTAAVIGSMALVVEVKSRLAVIENQVDQMQATTEAIFGEIQRIHPRQ